MRPTPRLKDGKWQLDLRPRYPHRLTLTTPGEERFREAAIHEAYARFFDLERRHEATTVQASLTLSGDSPLLREVGPLWLVEREREGLSGDNARYIRGYLAQVIRERGAARVSAFAPPHGKAFVLDYRNELAERGLSPKTRANRLSTLRQLLVFAIDRGWLLALPDFPEAAMKKNRETLSNPHWEWITEDDFRRLRDAIFVGPLAHAGLKAKFPDPQVRADIIGRRRLYLSVAFYTGMHTHDLDNLTDESLTPVFGKFLRVNTKSARCIPKKSFTAPEQLTLDGVEELERIGRHWRPGEAIAGGPWRRVTDVLRTAARRIGLPVAPTPRLFRRSTAYHLCLLGWQEEEVAEYLGHIDRQMVATVYRRVPVDLRWKGEKRLDWTNENMRLVTGNLTARARVIDFSKALKGDRKPPQATSAPSFAKRGKGESHGEG